MSSAVTGEVVSTVTGLTAAQVAQRIADGRVNIVDDRNSRSLGSIIRANTFTYFNALIGGLWILMLVCAPLIDSLFGIVIVINTAIGIIQEYRAAQTLAKLSLVGQAQALVRRDGVDAEIPPNKIVLDDIIIVRTGDQMLVDAQVLQSHGLELDESLLTGEADPVPMEIGSAALSGSFAVAGSGLVQATKVGADSYASVIAAEATKFSVTNSELRNSIQRFIKLVSWALIPIGIALFVSQYRANDGRIRDAVAGTVPGIITMVPEGLVLLTSVAMAVATIRLAERKVLVQDMPAVEVLARVDVVCVDKTGTLTQPGMAVQQLVTLDDSVPVEEVLGALGASEPEPNPTLQALISRWSAPQGWTTEAAIPFSSARKWSGATFTDHGSWVLGAPEMLLPDSSPVRTTADELAAGGARVVVLGSIPTQNLNVDGPIDAVHPCALVVIDQTLRPDAAETVTYFLEQGVKIKVISGDNAVTVGAIAAQAGIPGADQPYDARQLPDDMNELADVLEANSVFGRVTPAQKRAMVGALQSRGHTVAMTGDGVNDVLALKDADLGIAMGSGAGATRSVAQLVLLDDRFAVMPSVVAEGRRVLGNIERVSDLFLTKSFYATAISIATVIFVLPFPFLNRHLTVVTALTIGTPAFFLALMPNSQLFRKGFFKRVLRFAIPAGLTCAVSAYVTYGYVLRAAGDIDEARNAAVITLFTVAWWVLVQVARPLNPIRWVIVLAMLIGFLGVLFIPWLSNLFALSWLPNYQGLSAVAIGAVGAVVVTFIRHKSGNADGKSDDALSNTQREVSV
ncbi:MAG: HAD-IC family P-type ATPase [Actinomycetes bacterium]